MNPAYVVLLILAVIYVPIWVWAWRRPEAALRWHLVKYGPTIMIKTKLGMKIMDRFARYERFWHAFGFASKAISAVLFLLMMYMLIMAVLALPSRLSSGSSMGLEYALAIPGFNPILPLSYGVAALVIAMVVHELGHGIQARVNGMRVDSSGVLYGVVPLGAFVEPNEDDLLKAKRKAQIDVYAAGITVNTIVAVIAISSMLVMCGTATATYDDDPGVYYLDNNSPAMAAEIPVSAIIVGIYDINTSDSVGINSNGESMGDPLTSTLSGSSAYIDYPFDPKSQYILTYADGSGLHDSKPIQMGAMVKTVTVGSPAERYGLLPGQFIYSIETSSETHLIHSPMDFIRTMSYTKGGQTVTVTMVSQDYQTTEVDVVLSERNGIGFLGLSSTTGGMTFVTPEQLMDRATNPFYGVSSPSTYVQSFFSFISGPFQGMDPIPDDVKWWYDVPMGDIFWIIVSLLYWVFWLDILLAISNALPTYVLDGGFIFAGGVSWLLEKLRIKDEERRETMTNNIASAVSNVTLVLFILVIVSMVI